MSDEAIKMAMKAVYNPKPETFEQLIVKCIADLKASKGKSWFVDGKDEECRSVIKFLRDQIAKLEALA